MVWYKNIMIVVFCLQGLLVICLILKLFGFDKMENFLILVETWIHGFYFQSKIKGQPYQPESLLVIERPCVGEKIRNFIGNKKVKEPDANAQDEQAEDLNQEQQAGGPNHGGQERIPEQDDQEQAPSQDEQVEVPNLDPPNEPELPAEPSASCDVSERIGARNLIIQPGDLVSSNHEEGQVSDEGRDLNVPYVNATDDSYMVRDIIDGYFEGADDTTLSVDNGISAGIVYARNQAVDIHNSISQGVEGAEILGGLNKRALGAAKVAANSLGQTGAGQSNSGLGNNTEGRNVVETSHAEGRGGSSEGLENGRYQVNSVTATLVTGRMSISSNESVNSVKRRVSN
ncbi:hypothetical protein WICPIJ_005760 [Wickerhamomyces pijperi]|uniref:Uncharacterized protein n=1 Tax=Wickerhamomyces pijperi TaxID=599730 RepID=A0A9P8Q5C1_WICPI|nr:hypothetical protein WICPIJ_005760 [Wickerhamomyces pijperi]